MHDHSSDSRESHRAPDVAIVGFNHWARYGCSGTEQDATHKGVENGWAHFADVGIEISTLGSQLLVSNPSIF